MIGYILTLLALFISMIAQWYVNITYNKFLGKVIVGDKSGFDVAKMLLEKNNLSNIYVLETGGLLSDHYDPSRKVVKLSHDVFHLNSVASISVAAHEVGHAIQDKEGYRFFRIRSFFVPIVNLCSKFGYIAIIIGLIFSLFDLSIVGMILLSTTLIFQLITLPVELDASRRALDSLIKYKLVTKDEQELCRTMLRAAAFTYVASLVSTIFELLRLVLVIFDSNRRD